MLTLRLELPFTFQLGDGKTPMPRDTILKSLILHSFWEAAERAQKRKANGPYSDRIGATGGKSLVYVVKR